MATVNEKMTAIANEIRTLSGTTEPMGLDAMATNVNTANTEVTSQAELINQIVTTLEGKATHQDVTEETTTYSDLNTELEEVINSLPDVNSITPTLQEKTIIPTTSSQDILPDDGYDGLSKVVVSGDEDLIAENIKSGVSIFGVEGTHEGGDPLLNSYTYSGSSQPIDDGDGNWRIKFLSSGTLTVEADSNVDIFAVGGGGNGGNGTHQEIPTGAGGGGGYTQTVRNINLIAGETYTITVGAARGTSSIATESGNILCSADGGYNGASGQGGAGGSGGGPGTTWGATLGLPGSDGGNGTDTSTTYLGGKGQGSTTREFGEEDGDLYAGGGGGGTTDQSIHTAVIAGGSGGGGDGAYVVYGKTLIHATNGGENTGGGGGGGGAYSGYTAGGAGGSGIVIIRNARVITA